MNIKRNSNIHSINYHNLNDEIGNLQAMKIIYLLIEFILLIMAKR